MGSSIRIGPGIEEGELSSCGGAPNLGRGPGWSQNIVATPRTQIPKLTKRTSAAVDAKLILLLDLYSSTLRRRRCARRLNENGGQPTLARTGTAGCDAGWVEAPHMDSMIAVQKRRAAAAPGRRNHGPDLAGHHQ